MKPLPVACLFALPGLCSVPKVTHFPGSLARWLWCICPRGGTDRRLKEEGRGHGFPPQTCLLCGLRCCWGEPASMVPVLLGSSSMLWLPSEGPWPWALVTLLLVISSVPHRPLFGLLALPSWGMETDLTSVAWAETSLFLLVCLFSKAKKQTNQRGLD